MKHILLIPLFFQFSSLTAHSISNEEKIQIMKDIQILKERVQKLEDKTNNAGLKKINYQNEVTTKEKEKTPLSEDQIGNIQKELENYKNMQIKSQKILEELDKDE